MQLLTRNVLEILVEVLVILLAFLALTGVTRSILNRAARAAALSQFQEAANAFSRNLRTFYLVLMLVLLCSDVGGNGWLIYKGNDLVTFKLQLLHRVTPAFWMSLLVAVGKMFALALFVGLMLRPFLRIVNLLCMGLRRIPWLSIGEGDAEMVSETLQRHFTRLGWLLVLVESLDWVGLAELRQRFGGLVVELYIIGALAHVALSALHIVIATLRSFGQRFVGSYGVERYYRVLDALLPAFEKSLQAIIVVSAITAGISQIELLSGFRHWGTLVIQIIGILFLSRVLGEVISNIVEEFLVLRTELNEAQQKRRRTVVPLVSAFLRYMIYFLAGMIIITQLGINPLPILAGAGIAGVAIGIGAQSLIGDLVAGFFTLFENYYLVGDFVSIDGCEGEVEAINFRATWMRDVNGRVHILRNGQIHSIINYSREYVYAVVDVGVAYGTDLDTAFALLKEVGQWIAENSANVLEPTQVSGVRDFGTSAITLRTKTRVKPGRHLQVEYALRKRIVEVFAKNHIEIPYAHQVVILKDDTAKSA